ncbi:hypothetical protein [Blastopirellula retiformator]|uniref:Uncharacterized protein n=1 Tax=Blastopirellula retiformator TaxID=2527970 RepID=A0A5C5VL51_9BACT|nr:hypothetical protein [Blastopirellula retiformator]TWT38579.1 hypothetical protein Enr8_02720 [Blastopirellula retiformator]
MDELSDGATTVTSAEKSGAVPWKAMAFAAIYGVAMAALIATLSLRSLGFVWQTCIPVTGAAIAIGSYLLAMAPKRLLGIVVLLFLTHAIVVAFAYRSLGLQDPAMAKQLAKHLGVFLLSLACVSATLAYWNRRRYWRIERRGNEEPDPRSGRSLAMSRFDYFYLLASVGGLIAFHKVTESVPVSVVFVGVLQLFTRVALAPARRGFSPVAVILTGYGCLAAGCFAGWTFYPTNSLVLMVLVGLPATLWCGILLSLRADGYRRVRDFAAYAENLPIAEPDPLA